MSIIKNGTKFSKVLLENKNIKYHYMTHNVYESLESSNSNFNQQFTDNLGTTNLNQILSVEKQNDANYLAVSQEIELHT